MRATDALLEYERVVRSFAWRNRLDAVLDTAAILAAVLLWVPVIAVYGQFPAC